MSINLTPTENKIIESYFLSAENKRTDSLYEEAIIDYQKIISINPSHYDALNQLSCSLLQLKQFDEALQYSNKLIELHPDWDSYMGRAAIKKALGDIEGEEADRNKAWSIGKIACWG